MPDDPKVAYILARFDELKSERMLYERAWQDIRHLVRPHTTDFQATTITGSIRSERIYDGTAPEALEELASALHSYLTNPSDRWFSLDVQGGTQESEALEWLEAVSDLLYAEYASPLSNFNSSIHECYLDMGAFGTCVLNQELDANRLLFRAIPLSENYVAENSRNKVDTNYRCLKFTKRQLQQAFQNLPEVVVKEQNLSTKYEVIHGVYPRTDRDPSKATPGNKRFASCWLLKDPGWLLKESGYDSFPYHISRWSKLAEETYGRGPAIKCLPDIKMLNKMEYTIIKAGEKAVDPPLLVSDDGVVLPIRTSPGALIFHEPGIENSVVPLEHRGKLEIGLEMTDRKREQIRRAFYSEWVKLWKKKAEQTAYEIQEHEEEQLRMMGSMLGRVQDELLGPLIQRSYELLQSVDRIPPAPESLQRGKLKIIYVSPAARAQKAMKAVSMSRFVQELTPMAQIQPDIFDAIDMDRFAQEYAILRGLPQVVLRSPDEIEAVRSERQQAQQMAALAETLEPASKAVKNIAEANQAGGLI